MATFSSLDLLPTLQETLAEKGLEAMTEIQSRALPQLLKGRSIVGVAETGSGKTLTYALPVLHRLKSLENEGDPVPQRAQPARAVVLVPARELTASKSRACSSPSPIPRGCACEARSRRNRSGMSPRKT